ncbi:MAG TPA: hypothetical protein VN461_16000 [Vicinamibacteria bacterium]|nr:hypothetical protein [Vicinamibacteria bacterium]
MRVLERVLAILTVSAGSGWAIYVLAFGSDAGLTVPVLLALVWGGVAVLVVWSLRAGLHLLNTRGLPGQRHLRRVIAQPAALALCFALVWSEAAFRIRFWLSRPALQSYVQRARPSIRHGEFRPGVRVGLFWLREAEALPGGVVRLITTQCMFDDCGVVYSPVAEPPRIGRDIYSALGGPWYHWRQGW